MIICCDNDGKELTAGFLRSEYNEKNKDNKQVQETNS
jgi:hypothetical protein